MSMHLFLLLAAIVPVLWAGPSRADQEPAAIAGMLAAHNAARQEAGVPALRWSEALTESARRLAETLRGGGCNMRHSSARGIGENLAWASGQTMSPAQVVGMWVDEKRHFDAARNRCAQGAVCGHYTQVVWRTTSEVGCAKASCGRSEVWVCQYTPPGNFVGQRPF